MIEDKAQRVRAALTIVVSKVEVASTTAVGTRDLDIEAIRKVLASVRSEMATAEDLAAVKADIALLKWMFGFLLASGITVLFKIFSHQ